MLTQAKNLGTVLIMAGGTGGHIFPALSIARTLQSQGYRTEWLGTARGLEVDVLSDTDIPLHLIEARGLRGKGLRSLITAPFMIVSAIFQALKVIRKVQPCCVLGMGGYVTGPGGVAAKLSGRKLLIHEQNAIAGFSNRLLSRIANAVMQAFPETFPASVQALTTGNPVRTEISALAAKHYAESDSPLRILVIGGSLGAMVFNTLMPKVLNRFSSETRPQIWHQVGKNNIDAATQAYAQAGLSINDACRVEPFITDMAAAYEWADIVVCRAGALTVSEVAAAGIASILVPYPHAVDDHQTRNAESLSEQNAAVLIQQKDLSEDGLYELLAFHQGDRSELQTMAQQARKTARLDANELVAQQCIAACKG
ncbi:MAG: undecaprenyldiphospho-muramoylpentapeptide beta-N-acetylglucosaminyltransferase [Gammaproteobacteria bacterium]